LLAALWICSLHFSRVGEAPFLIPLVIAALAYLLALREFSSSPKFPRRVTIFGLVLSAVWHLFFLPLPPGLDDDVHRYVWDGRVQHLGYNPYVLVPNDPALAGLHTAETRTLNNPEVPSPYPPGAQLFFRAVTAIHESVFAMKIAFVLCDVGIVLVLLDVLRRTGYAENWVLAFAWHPLLATEVAGSGHIDILGALLLLMSAAALLRRWHSAAAVAFGLAVSVKLLPIVLLPLFWKRIRVRDAALAAAVCGFLYLPFLDHGHIPFGGLGTYVQRFRFNGPIFATLERVMAPQWIIALVVLAGLVTAVCMKRKRTENLADAFSWPMAASLLCAPVVYPWYMLWLLPFARSTPTLPITVWTLSIIPTYYVWHLRTVGGQWLVPNWILTLEYGAAALTAAILVFRKFSRPPAVEHAERGRPLTP